MKKSRMFHVVAIMLPLLFFSLWSFAQSMVVHGTVKDPEGMPMPGVTVLLKGTTQGTITNLDGNYSFEGLNANNVLVFSFVGMISQEITVGNRTVINVTLESSISDIDEVVVVGYGTQRKEAVTGSVASVAGDIVRDVPSANISQSLQGRVAGVQMQQSSSKPGAEMQIRIRGTRSLNANNDPLVILDGMPFAGTLGDINPADIKSVDILKDASATAIYGSRGANGVILVTSNKGKKGQAAQLTYNGYYGIKNPFSQYPMMNGAKLKQLRADAGLYTNGADESDDMDTNWQDRFYQTGKVSSHDIMVGGGNESSIYSFGTGYYREEAVMPGQDYTRYSVRGSMDLDVNDYFRFGFNTNNTYSITNGNSLSMVNVLSQSPLINPIDANGEEKRAVETASDQSWIYTKNSINNLGDKFLDENKIFGSYNTVYAEVKIPKIEGLKYRVNMGLNFRQIDYGGYTGEGVFNFNAKNPSTATIRNEHKTNWTIENLLTYDRVFAGKHAVNVVALYSAEQDSYHKSQVSTKGVAENFQCYNLAFSDDEKTMNARDQNFYEAGLISYMGRAMYSYDNRYMISATIRSDASSRLAEGHQWHTYPAVSMGWNIGEESFMEDVTLVDALKLRVGYGETSNQSVDPYKTKGLLATRPYNFGNDTYSTGFYVSELPNENLGWEYSKTWNYGVDFALLDSRLSGSVEYYVQKTNDVLLSVNLPGTSGVSSYMANIGKTENKGWELSLNGLILDDNNGWTWEAGVNLYSNHNELVSLASGQLKDESNWWFVGHPIDVIYDYEKIGIWQEDEEELRKIMEPAGNAGMIKVKGGYDEDGTPREIGTDDRQIIEMESNFQGGFDTRLAYKGLDLSIVGSFQNGGKLISTLYSASGYLNMLNGRRGNVDVDYWTPENTDAKYPKPGGETSNDNPKYGSTLGYFDASYLKIRTMSLGYNFSQPWVNKAGIDKLRIYATVQNPFVFFSPYKKESGMDPETNSFGNENQAVTTTYKNRLLVVGASTPSTRTFLFGINLTF